MAREAGREKIKVFGNLPYYITSPCLMHFFRYHAWIDEIVVMVQEEVARRIVAQPGSAEYGLLSLTCQYYTQPALLFSVGAKIFLASSAGALRNCQNASVATRRGARNSG